MTRAANPEREARILDAGLALFLRNGLRGTSMEAIAREAGVAKPTLYSYFADKEVLFAAVVRRLIGELRVKVSAELVDEDAPVQRIAGALATKSKAIFRLMEGSPHAAELYGENARLTGAEMAAFEHWLEDEIVSVLETTGRPEPRKWAQLLIACAEGISKKAQFAEQIGPAIRLVTEKLLD